jgi:VWFA-related protein
MSRCLLFLALTLLLARPAAAQSFGETVEVRVANIDVIVTTKDGGKVSGLQPRDFELLVDGQPRQISNFHEVKGAAALRAPQPADSAATSQPEASRRRANVVLFVDMYSLELRQRQQAVAALKEFIRTSLQPDDRVMLAVWNRRLILPVPFTTERDPIFEELDRMATQGQSGLERDRKIASMRVMSALESAEVAAGSRQGGTSFPQAYASSLEMARTHAEEQGKLTKLLAESMEELLRVVAGVDGRKVLVVLGENFPRFPVVDFYQYINDLFMPHSSRIQMTSPQIEAAKYSLAGLPGRIAKIANANEVTIHAIYSGTRPADDNVETKQRGATLQQQFLEFTNSGTSFAQLASETGGAALVGSTNFGLAAKQLSEDLDGYYSIAYRVPAGETGSRRIEVRPKNPAFVVRAKKAYVPKSLDEEIGDRVTSRLVLLEETRSDQIAVKLGTPKRKGRDRMSVAVQITFPSSLLTTFPQDGKQAGGFEIILASRDDENRLSEVARRSESFAWPEGAIPPSITYSLELVVRSRPGAVSVGVVDRLTRQVHHQVIDVGKPVS